MYVCVLVFLPFFLSQMGRQACMPWLRSCYFVILVDGCVCVTACVLWLIPSLQMVEKSLPSLKPPLSSSLSFVWRGFVVVLQEDTNSFTPFPSHSLYSSNDAAATHAFV